MSQQRNSTVLRQAPLPRYTLAKTQTGYRTVLGDNHTRYPPMFALHQNEESKRYISQHVFAVLIQYLAPEAQRLYQYGNSQNKVKR